MKAAKRLKLIHKLNSLILNMNAKLILASTSIYRKQLLQRLNIPFETIKPSFDEEIYKNKGRGGAELSLFLAVGKAKSVLQQNACVIGSDQVVSFEGKILGKSHTPVKAFEQIKSMQGKTHQLITSTCLIFNNEEVAWTNIMQLKMRSLTDPEIQNYVAKDNPVDCAGSYKIESFGISLFEQIQAEDFTAIQGLPLLKLHFHLKKWGF